MRIEWGFSRAGHKCAWCASPSTAYMPADALEADDRLCRGHVAEFMGESLAGLDRAEQAAHADMADLGYFDR